ncbi:SbcC/MukB-like Walker B domain-containing protein [Anaerophilus nitritogenes]|uniref:SbcC/MukB-like Walker B domain-containing protein n=1 Tax=Anaerophilus nitritogenes TaxID=2498136 RepID=UPI00101B8EDC|nr:SbcC/MukB-like Walker B domain-containing protein [Anaerophilus nitritogenes]
MKPIALKIKGLNSFIDEQIIDFKTLTEKGLFGIFGPTGSGKSTILDGITIALFGEIVRKNKDFINMDCEDLLVSYEFEIGKGDKRKSYVAQRNLKRDKNGSIKTKYARLIDKEANGIIAEKPTEVKNNVEKILGLTLDDFTRSVVLPQGKFSEFLKLKGKDKRDMLERIFNLEKYGKKLGEKIKKARNKNFKKQNELSGELRGFEGISEEIYKKNKKELNILKIEEKELIQKKEKSQEEYEKYKDIWNFQNELKEYEIKLKEYDIYKDEIEKLKQKSQRGENASIIQPYIDEVVKIENEYSMNKKELIEKQKELNEIDEKIIKIEEEYKIAQKTKDEQIPILSKKEIQLQHAIDLEKEMDRFKKEREELLGRYYEILDQRNSLDKKKKENEEIQKNIISLLNEKEIKIQDIKINRDDKEKIETALEVERKYEDQKKRQENLQKKLKEKMDSFSKNKKDYDEILKVKKEKEKSLHLLLKEQEKLQNNCPGDSELLLKKQREENEWEQRVKIYQQDFIKRDELKILYDENHKKKIHLEEKINKRKKEIEEKENIKKILEEEINQIIKNYQAFIIAKNLDEGEPCPVCGSIHHEKLAQEIDDTILEDKKQSYEELQTEIEKINHQIREDESYLIFYEKEEKRLKSEVDTLDEKIGGTCLEEILNSYEKMKEEFKIVKEKINHWNEEKEKMDEKIEKLKNDKNHIDKKEIELKGYIHYDEEVIVDLQKELYILQIQFDDLYEEYKKYQYELKIENFKEEMKRIKKIEEEIEKLQNEQKSLRKEIDEKINIKEKINKEISVLDVDLNSILEVGKEKKNIIDKNEKELKNITDGKDTKTYINDIKNKISEIHAWVKNSGDELENIKNKKEILKNLISSKNGKNENLIEQIKQYKQRIDKLLKEYSFESKEEVLKYFISKEEIENINQRIKNFEDEFKNILRNIDRLKNLLKNDRIDEESWNKIKEDQKNYELFFKEKIIQIASLEHTLKKMKEDLEKVKDIQKMYWEVEHQLSILSDIDKLIQGNKFVEFVAMNQLKYIAKEASKYLMNITGRYGLEIDDEGNFTIRDDKNGGVVRETASLSGGETFLTSLALALALSSQIQLKGSAPLEFFFLDEGFGTLDADLLEVVMTSLEKLHTDKLSVGIISHVEELKNRVPVKIIVTPSEYGVRGSQVKLEYS